METIPVNKSESSKICIKCKSKDTPSDIVINKTIINNYTDIHDNKSPGRNECPMSELSDESGDNWNINDERFNDESIISNTVISSDSLIDDSDDESTCKIGLYKQLYDDRQLYHDNYVRKITK